MPSDSSRPAPPTSRPVRALSALLRVEPGELRPVGWACLFFFCILCAYYALRPVRDAMGIASGLAKLQWLYTATFFGMLLAQPVFAHLVSRWTRARFIPVVYRFGIACRLGFFALLVALPEDGVGTRWVARAFFVWLSVINLFLVSIFWGYMADLFRSHRAKRLFGLIAIGGSVGALSGSGLATLLAGNAQVEALLLVAAVLLELGVFAARRVPGAVAALRATEEDPSPTPVEPPRVGGRFYDGFLEVVRSPYLIGICGYLLLYTTTSTFLYFSKMHVVEARFGSDRAASTELFAQIDLAVNALTLLIQTLLTGRIVAAIGIGLTMTLLPLATAAGFAALGVAPILVVIVVFEVTRRTTQFAIGKPTREILYTPLERSQKYKAKSFIDTFLYRGGDAVSGWAFSGLSALGAGLATIAWIAVPLSLAWAALGFGLGRRHERMAGRS